MRVNLTIFGDEEIARDLLRFGDRARNMRPIFEELAEDFYQIEERQFSSEGGFGSGGWAPLSDTYAAWKSGMVPGAGILEFTGDLRDSLTGDTNFGAIKNVSASELFLSSSIEYAAYHQSGTRNMPARKPVEFRLQDRRRWTKAIQRWLVRDEIGPEATMLTGVGL